MLGCVCVCVHARVYERVYNHVCNAQHIIAHDRHTSQTCPKAVPRRAVGPASKGTVASSGGMFSDLTPLIDVTYFGHTFQTKT